MNSLRWLLKIKFDEILSALILISIVFLIFFNVLGRYVLPVSWAFTEELTCGLLVLVSLWGAAGAARRGEFLGLDMLVDRFTGRLKNVILSLQPVSVLIFTVMLFVFGIEMVQSELKYGIRTAALGWPEAVFGSFIPIGAIFLILASLQRLITIWMKDNNSGEKGEPL